MTLDEFAVEMCGVESKARLLGLTLEQASSVHHATRYMGYLQPEGASQGGIQLVLHSRTQLSIARLIPATAQGYRIETWVGGKRVLPR